MTTNRPTPPPVGVESLTWVKAKASSHSGACVELAAVPEGWIAVRDSKNPSGPMLAFTAGAFANFIADVQRVGRLLIDS
jgi:Domain of unknown function (DUF397)